MSAPSPADKVSTHWFGCHKVHLECTVQRRAEPCEGFAWIGQSIDHCDQCGWAAWDHDRMTRLKKDAGPFDCGDGEGWEQKPWADGIVASWLKNGLIDRERAAALLLVK